MSFMCLLGCSTYVGSVFLLLWKCYRIPVFTEPCGRFLPTVHLYTLFIYANCRVLMNSVGSEGSLSNHAMLMMDKSVSLNCKVTNGLDCFTFNVLSCYFSILFVRLTCNSRGNVFMFLGLGVDVDSRLTMPRLLLLVLPRGWS